MATKFEYHDAAPDTLFDAYGTAWWIAQSFTVQVGEVHSLTKVVLSVYRNGSPGTVTVSIRAADGNERPTGADLVSNTFDGDAVTADSGGEWKEVPLALDLVEGNQYCIVMRAPSGNVTNTIRWLRLAAAAYAGGVASRSNTQGATWIGVENGDDFLFEEWGDSPPPSSAGGFNPALAGLML